MPARPAGFLSPASHKQRREPLRAQLLAHGVAVVFAAPVRNRANDADYVYHQNSDLHYLTGYDEPDAVLLFKESRTVGGRPASRRRCLPSSADHARKQWTGRRLVGAAGAKPELALQFTADNHAFAVADIKRSNLDRILFDILPADTRNDFRSPARPDGRVPPVGRRADRLRPRLPAPSARPNARFTSWCWPLRAPGLPPAAPGPPSMRSTRPSGWVISAEFLRLGTIKNKDEQRRYYPHGADHCLGLDVHDRGPYGSLQAGNVVTVGPSVYIPAGSPCDPE